MELNECSVFDGNGVNIKGKYFLKIFLLYMELIGLI